MSQPHNGQKMFSPRGNPFRAFILRKSYLSPKLISLLHSFEQDLADNLRKLKPKDEGGVFRLSWMGHAMECLSKTHTSIKTLVTDLKYPISKWDEKWIDMYLDDSVKLLDICNALSSEISQLNQGQLSLQYSLHVLDFSNKLPASEDFKRAHAYLHDWTQQIGSRSSKLETCAATLQGLAENLSFCRVRWSAKGKVLLRALYGVKVETLFVCSVLILALLGSPKPLATLHVPNKFLWAEAFNELQTCINGELMSLFSCGKAAVLKEVEAVKASVEKVHILTGMGCRKVDSQIKGISHDDTLEQRKNIDQVEDGRLQEFVSDLAKSADELSQALDLLSKQVSNFFQIVLTGRDALLCNLRASGDAPESNVNRNIA